MTAALDHGGGKPMRSRLSMAAPPPVRQVEDEIDLLAFLRLIRRQMVLITVVGGLLLAVQLPFIMMMERTYFAQLRLLIHRPPPATLAMQSATALDLAIEVERLVAQKNVAEVIAEFGLAESEEFNPPPRPPLLQRLGLVSPPPPPTEANPQDAVINNFYEALSVRRNGQTNVLEIGFRSLDPELAAQIPNALVRVYLAARGEQLRAQVDQADSWLARRIAEQADRVTEMEAANRSFRAENGPMSANFQLEAMYRISALGNREAELRRQQSDLRAMRAELEAGREVTIDSDPIGAGMSVGIRRDLQLQRRELARLLQIYGERHPDVVSARAAIEETQEAIRTENAGYIQALDARLAGLAEEEAVLYAELQTVRDRLSRMAAAETEYEVMTADLDRERAALVALEQQQRTIVTEGLLPLAEAEILSPASVPRAPDGRGRKFYLLAGALAALAAGVTVACIREMLDRSLRSQKQIAAIPQATAAGMIPILQRRGGMSRAERVRRRQDETFVDAVRWLILSAEQANGGKMPASMLVTSALPNEGKSLVALALATELVRQGHSVLLVDADTSCGSVHAHFGTEASPGYADYLANEAEFDDLIRHDPVTGIDYIPLGTAMPSSRTRLLGGLEVVQRARKHNQIVIFDAAPAVATTDTTSLAGITSQTVMVIEWGKTQRNLVELAAERLAEAGASQILLTMNQVNPRRLALYGFKDAGLFAPELRKYRTG